MSKPTLCRGSHAPRALGALSACIAMLAASSAVAVPGSLPDEHLGRSPLLVGNPIHAGTGNKYQAETDYEGSGAFPLKLVRHYNSQANKLGRLGYDWSLLGSLAVSGSSAVTATRPDGRAIQFSYLNGQWQADADVTERLARLTDGGGNTIGWELTLPDRVVETYSASGTLTGLRHPSGLAQTVSYPSASQVVIADSFGRTLSLNFNAQNNLETMTDPAGGVTRYAYDANGNLAAVAYPDATPADDTDNPRRLYHYEDTRFPHALTGITDENGVRYATYAYDAQGRAVLSEHAGGAERTALTFNADGSTTVTDANGAARTYGHSSVLGVVKSTGISQPGGSGCSAAASQVSYDAYGNVASRADFNGHTTTYAYDLARNLEVSRTEAAGTTEARTISTAWHASFRLPVSVTEPGRQTTYAYDAYGNLTQKSLRDTQTSATRTWSWTWTYSASVPGALLKKVEDGPRTDVADLTTWDYYAPDAACDGGHAGCRGQLRQVTDALGHVTHVSRYNAHGQPEVVIDANGVTATLAYDARGRLIAHSVGAETTAYAYDGAGQLTQLTLPDGSAVTFTYDAAHRLTEIADTLGHRIVYTLDGLGNRLREERYEAAGGLAQTGSGAFDALGRLAQQQGAQSQTTILEYDANGNPTAVIDPLNHTTRHGYDALERLTQRTDAANGVTGYLYDGRDRLTRVTDPRGLATAYTWDGLDNLVQEASPDRGTIAYGYDAAGNLVSRTDARGVASLYTYDGLGRLSRISYQTPRGSKVPASAAVDFQYDQGANGIGRLTGLSDGWGSTSYAYDPQGRLVQKTQTAAGGTARTHAYSYDAAGRLIGVTYPSGSQVQYDWSQGRVSGIRVNGQVLLDAIQYRPGGRVGAWTWGNGTAHAAQFDLDGRPEHYPLGSLQRSLAYDAAGRITGYTHAGQAAADQAFGYDALDRLTGYSASTTSEGYQYDADGNRTQATVGAAAYPYAYAADSNRLLSVAGPVAKTYTYDAAGNATADGTLSYVYDARGRLIEVKAGKKTQASYAYNGLGQRVEKSAASLINGPHRYVYDEAGHLVGEYDNTGAARQETVWLGNMPVAVLKGGYLYYVHADQLNAPRVVTDTANTAVWRWLADPFGSTLAEADPDGNGIGFEYNLRLPGQYYDAETGLHYNYFRDYDPKTGRYVQSDPIGLEGGLNLYAYVDANPLKYTDPLGLCRPGWMQAEGQQEGVCVPDNRVVPDKCVLGGCADYPDSYNCSCMNDCMEGKVWRCARQPKYLPMCYEIVAMQCELECRGKCNACNK